MTRSRIRSVGPLGTAVVFTFLLGLVSAPLRTCFSHPGHEHGSRSVARDAGTGHTGHDDAGHAGHHAAGHAGHRPTLASGVPADPGTPTGCECLGICQLETSPYLPLRAALAHVVSPAPEPGSWREVGDLPVAGAPHAAPLARGPPLLA